MRTIFYQLPLACLLVMGSTQFLSAQGGFGEADANGDEKVDAVELKAYVSGKLSDFDRFDELLTELDTNKDGSVSSEEFGRRMAAIQSVKERSKPEMEEQSAPQDEVVEFVEQYERMFAKREPKIGAPLPNAKAFDEEGNPFELKQTHGKYTVIVFGCLT